MNGKTAIIVVNWNSWEDTLRCVIASCNLDGFIGTIVVVDNKSSDNSVEQIKLWVKRNLEITCDSDADEIKEQLAKDPRNIWSYIFVKECDLFDESKKFNESELCVYIISSSENKGFAAANNIGIKFAMHIYEFEFFWLLNPDAIPAKNSFRGLIDEVCRIDAPFVAGSVLVEYWNPKQIQAVGSSFNRILLKVKHNQEGEHLSILSDMPNKIEVDYPVGASLMLNKQYIDEHGLLEERYFLYFEEIDLAIRVKPEYVFIVPESIVYHKGGASTGSGKVMVNRSSKADYYYVRGRIILSRKINGMSFYIAIIASMYSVLNRVMHGRIDLALSALRGFRDGCVISFR
ncbi:glycosyltransferase family 2 protein [Chlorobium limicola]